MTQSQHSQRGIALLLFLFLALGFGTTLFLSAWNSNRFRQEQERKTELALQQAKEALIAFAAADPTLPGRLPCPEDTSRIGGPTEGTALSCSNGSIHAGRIAWRTLGLDNPRDAADEQLWYVLSPGFRGTTAVPINSESSGQLIVDSQPVGAVALIIAPGLPQTGQNRTMPTATNPPDITQYLDGTNADGDSSFTAIPIAGTVNDKVLAIYPADLMAAVEKRVANEVRYALLEYYCGIGHVNSIGNCTTPAPPSMHGYFPRPAAFTDPTCLGTAAIPSNCPSAIAGNEGRLPANPISGWDNSSLLRGSPISWFQKNGWRELVYYGVAPACIDGTIACTGAGYLTVQISSAVAINNARAVIIVGGHYLGVSGRSKTTVADYLEDQNASTGDNVFTLWPTMAGTVFNDHLIIIP